MSAMKTVEQESSAPGLRIVPATVEDLPAIVSLERRCGLNSRGTTSHQSKLMKPNAILLVAVADDACSFNSEIIGMFSGDVVVDELQIDNLAVSENCRRKGVGRLLLRSALSFAHRLGARMATLEVRSANLTARSFYEKEGFVLTGLRKGYYAGPFDDALLLSREIDG
jgi:ribosomal-protein-alanine N-acetyltransferase